MSCFSCGKIIPIKFGYFYSLEVLLFLNQFITHRLYQVVLVVQAKAGMLPFLRSCDCASWQILIIKPTRCTNFSNLFWNEVLYVSDTSSVHHQEFFTVHTAMVYMSYRFVDRIRMFHPDPAQKPTNLYDIYHCCVYSEKLLMMDRGIVRNVQRFIPK